MICPPVSESERSARGIDARLCPMRKVQAMLFGQYLGAIGHTEHAVWCLAIIEPIMSETIGFDAIIIGRIKVTCARHAWRAERRIREVWRFCDQDVRVKTINRLILAII